MMRLLVLGGTRFVGRHLVEAALAAGHQVTIFNRGRSNPTLFPQAERLIGDRHGGLDPLEGRRWDVVLDVNGYLPRLVRASAELLARAAERCVFVSTLAVYADASPGRHEGSPLATLQDPAIEEVTSQTYGALKVLCEQAVEASFPGRTLILRPGYIVGPFDYTDRFTYWVRRVGQGGEMLAPGEPDTPLQFIDARDLASFALRMIESMAVGAYNITGPQQPLTWGRFLQACKEVLQADTTFTWVDEAFLESHGVTEEELPMWPRAQYRGVMQTDIRKALAAGLSYRPLQDTIRDIWDWDRCQGVPKAGLSREGEVELLQAWHGRG